MADDGEFTEEKLAQMEVQMAELGPVAGVKLAAFLNGAPENQRARAIQALVSAAAATLNIASERVVGGKSAMASFISKLKEPDASDTAPEFGTTYNNRRLPYLYKNQRFYHNDVAGYRDMETDVIAAKDYANALALAAEDRLYTEYCHAKIRFMEQQVASHRKWT